LIQGDIYNYYKYKSLSTLQTVINWVKAHLWTHPKTENPRQEFTGIQMKAPLLWALDLHYEHSNWIIDEEG